MKRLLAALIVVAALIGACVIGLCSLPPDIKVMFDDALGDLGTTLGAIFGADKDQTQTPPPGGDPTGPDDADNSDNVQNGGGSNVSGAEPYDEEKMMAQADGVLQERLRAAISNRQVEVEIADLGYDSVRLKEQMARFFFTRPELFFVDNEYSYFSEEKGGKVTKIKLTYLYSESQIGQMNVFYESAVDDIVAGVPAGASDFDKVLYLHDYLVQNYAYDYEGLAGTPIRDAYNFFKTGRGVCQAYMLAMIALCEEVGIPCLPVTSDAMEHAWNLVKLDGKWYHVDVTWDDAGGEESAVYPSFVSYRYFLLSGEALYNSGRRELWSVSEHAVDTLYDAAAWRETTTRMVKLDGHYYFVLFDTAEKTSKLYRGTATQAAAVLTMQDVKWFGSPNSFYHTAWAGLAVWSDVLIVSTDKAFFRYDARTNTLTQLADLTRELGDRQIFGICGVDDDGTVHYVAAKDYHGEYETRAWKIPTT